MPSGGRGRRRKLGRKPCGCSVSINRLYMVNLKGGEPGDKAYQQPVRAATGEMANGCLTFLAADGSLAAFFDSDVVLSWREIREDELSK